MLSTIKLINFRNHAQVTFSFKPGITVVVGENAAGKTNILEAIWLLATGESFRAKKVDEMVMWGHEVGHVMGEVRLAQRSKLKTENEQHDSNAMELHVSVTRGMVQGKRVQKRLYKVNGAPRRKQDFVGLLPVVVFRPEDLRLLDGSPDLRRDFLDAILIQIQSEYRRSLASYQRGLKQRNRLLDQIRDGKTTIYGLTFWNQLLIKEGQFITTARQDLIEKMNQVSLSHRGVELDYVASPISERLLAERQQTEIAVGYTLIGPHKDDFRLFIHQDAAGNEQTRRDLAVYGSRGEQRMGVLWLKEAELARMTQALETQPLLLLDDIFSELDEAHIREVVECSRNQQTIITTTDVDTIGYFETSPQLIRLDHDTDSTSR